MYCLGNSSTQCPTCKKEYQSIVKLFLNFDDSKIEGINKLLIESQDIEKRFIQVAEQYTIIRREFNNLNKEMAKSSAGKIDFIMYLSDRYSVTMGKVKKALKQNKVLLQEVDKKIKELTGFKDDDKKDAPALPKQCTDIYKK
uniref:Uncharacterized protein n=1 Tax=Glossina austeni TaxID=7395 RepID=A0A1A9UF36_GLOAU